MNSFLEAQNFSATTSHSSCRSWRPFWSASTADVPSAVMLEYGRVGLTNFFVAYHRFEFLYSSLPLKDAG
jgi:hypothetical protein